MVLSMRSLILSMLLLYAFFLFAYLVLPAEKSAIENKLELYPLLEARLRVRRSHRQN